eukprot:234025-Alexandrium_andersonii.AAC.1
MCIRDRSSCIASLALPTVSLSHSRRRRNLVGDPGGTGSLRSVLIRNRRASVRQPPRSGPHPRVPLRRA